MNVGGHLTHIRRRSPTPKRPLPDFDGQYGAPEQCDDGNNFDADGCSSVCVVEQPSSPPDRSKLTCAQMPTVTFPPF